MHYQNRGFGPQSQAACRTSLHLLRHPLPARNVLGVLATAQLLTEGAPFPAVVPPGAAVDAGEVVLAVGVGAQQPHPGLPLAEQGRLLGAAELQVGCGHTHCEATATAAAGRFAASGRGVPASARIVHMCTPGGTPPRGLL